MAAIRHPGGGDPRLPGDDANAFLVMEYVEGEALSRRLHRSGSIDPTRTMRMIAQAADALHAAHLNGVVHRDIKPGNLLVTPTDTVVLTDFGIARWAASTPLTATGAVVGTPSSRPNRCCAGHRPPDVRPRRGGVRVPHRTAAVRRRQPVRDRHETL